MEKTYEDFAKKLAMSESSGRYDVENKFGYLGKYQMGEQALHTAGYYKLSSNYSPSDPYLRWNGTWTGKDGVWSKRDYLNNHSAQENAVRQYHAAQWRDITSKGLGDYVGKTINEVEITPSGLIAGAHLVGPTGLKNYLRSGGQNVRKDAFNTSVETYIQKFGGYDTYDVTKIPTYERYKEEFGIKKPKYTPDKVVKIYNTKVEKEIEDERKYFSNVYKEYKQHVKDVIKYGDRVNKERKAFLEGFDSGSIKPSKLSSKKSPKTKTGSMTLGDGKWITTKQGNHVFIED